MARIDDSHQPFKRKKSIGPGPLKYPKVDQVGVWVCRRAKPTKTHYVQVCKNTETGSKHTSRVKKARKKKYNAIYRRWAAGKRLAARPALRSYRCRRTSTTKCR